MAIAGNTTLNTGRWHWERRSPSMIGIWVYRLGAITLVLVLAGAAMALTLGGVSILPSTLSDTFGNTSGLGQVLILAAPFIFTGAAVGAGRRVGLWNVGGEGQFFIGGWTATAVAFAVPHFPGIVLIPAMLLAGGVGGAAWILVPALARAYLNVNEVITTLMLNMVAGLWTIYWATGPWRDPFSQGGSLSSQSIPAQANLPQLGPSGAGDGFGVLIAAGVIIVVWLLFGTTIFGYRSAIVGASPTTGHYAGINVRQHMVGVMLLSGALAGMGGVVELCGDVHNFSPALSNNTGYLGIAVAVLGGYSFGGIVVMAWVMAAILATSDTAQTFGISSQAVFVVVGALLLLSSLAEVVCGYRLVRAGNTRGRTQEAQGTADSETSAHPELESQSLREIKG